MPVVIPQIYGYPPAGDPATLGGQIEIVPNVAPQRSRSRATYQVVPTDPLPPSQPQVEVLPSPPRPDYYELPPPPR